MDLELGSGAWRVSYEEAVANAFASVALMAVQITLYVRVRRRNAQGAGWVNALAAVSIQ